MRYHAIFPCFVPAIAADQIGSAWGVLHTHYSMTGSAPIAIWSVAAMIAEGIIFGPIGMIYMKSSEHRKTASDASQSYVKTLGSLPRTKCTLEHGSD